MCVSVCFSVPKDLANHWTDMVLCFWVSNIYLPCSSNYIFIPGIILSIQKKIEKYIWKNIWWMKKNKILFFLSIVHQQLIFKIQRVSFFLHIWNMSVFISGKISHKAIYTNQVFDIRLYQNLTEDTKNFCSKRPLLLMHNSWTLL